MNFDFTCTASRILLDVPFQIAEAERADPNGQIFITRLLHNKIGFYLSNYLRCYLSYFSFENILIAILFYTGVYFLFKRRSKLLLILLIFPLFALFEIFPVMLRGIILVFGYIIVCAYGLFNIFSRFRSKNI